jgi:hypothetical protein
MFNCPPTVSYMMGKLCVNFLKGMTHLPINAAETLAKYTATITLSILPAAHDFVFVYPI